MKLRLTFGLRTLFIILTAACVYLGYAAYRLSLQGECVKGTNFTYDVRIIDAESIAKVVRERTGELIGHESTDEPIELTERLFTPGFRALQRSTLSDQFFYRVTLSDGSVTHVGFWVYKEHPSVGRPMVGVTFLLHAWDTYPEVVSGVAEKRRKERRVLYDKYLGIVRDLQQESLKKLEPDNSLTRQP